MFFFFSSRRRHTRCGRDWSSDVCSSDLISNPEVASASIFFILLAIAFGLVTRLTANRKYAFAITSVIGATLMYYFVYLGTQLPLSLDFDVWIYLLLAYAFLASVSPVSMLLQPRDYLNSFLLYGLILSAVIGIFIADPIIEMDT